MQVAVIHTAFEDTPTVVAYVDTSKMLINTASKEEALTAAYHFTQNIYGSWSMGSELPDGSINEDFNRNVLVMTELPVVNGKTFGLRSTSMGDQMIIGTTKYNVDMMGFSEIEG